MKKTLLIYIFLTLIIFNVKTFATIYYVDATNGNDNNNGTSPSTPWKTLAKINNFSFQPGDKIFLKRGDIWNENLVFPSSGTQNNPIEIGAYGTGDKPVINGMQEVNLNWTNYNGNVWKTNLGYHTQRLLKNGVELLRANNYNEMDGIQFMWYYDENSQTLYLYSTTNPNNEHISINVYYDVFLIQNKQYINVRDIEVRGGYGYGMAIRGCSHINITNCTVGRYSFKALQLRGYNGSNVSYCTVDSCTVDAYWFLDYSNAGTYAGSSLRGQMEGIMVWEGADHIDILHNYIKNWGHANLNIYSTGSGVTNCRFLYNYLTAPDVAYGGRISMDGVGCNYNEIAYNIIENIHVRNQINGSYNHIHHNIINGVHNSPLKTYGSGQGFEMQPYDGVDVVGNIFENNTIMNCDEGGISFRGWSSNTISNCIVRNNIFYNCGANSMDGNTGCGITFFSPQYVGPQTFENNCFYSSQTNNVVKYRTGAMTVAQFNAQNGNNNDVIQNNIQADPLFVDYNSGDFHLQSTSPCIDAGTTPQATIDFDGNTIPYGNGPDIGAYEYTGNVTPQPPTANFTYTSDCNGTVTFTDLSSGNPTSWYWNFGDGQTSSLQNPSHTYSTPGTYTVTLIASNSNGSDTISQTVNAQTISEPQTQNQERCGPGTLTLHATGNVINWYDSQNGGNLLHTGSDFTTPYLTQTTTYYVENASQSNTYYGGKTDNSGSGGYYNYEYEMGEIFDVTDNIILKSVKIYANSQGTRTIKLIDENGNIIYSSQVNLNQGENTVDLNYNIQPGNNYRLVANQQPDLFRNDAAANLQYPYDINGVVQITKSTAADAGGNPTDYYYFFYNWEVVQTGCVSDRIPVQAIINTLPEAEFTYSVNNLTVTFQNNSTGDSYHWDFGDGQTSNIFAPIHSYDAPGTYTVMLVANSNSCGSDTTYQTITVTAGQSQGSLSIFDENNVNVSNQTITVYGQANGMLSKEFNIVNTSNNNLLIKLKKLPINVGNGTSNTFCFGGQCYGASTMVSQQYQLNSGDTTQFDAEYFPNGFVGQSTILYTVYDASNPNDSVSITIIFDTEQTLNNFIADNNHISIYPNPAKNYFFINFKSSAFRTVSIIDQAGQKFLEKKIYGNKVKIERNDLKQGLFYIIVTEKNQVYSGKVIFN